MPLQKAQTNFPDTLNPYSPYNQQSPNFAYPTQAHINHGGNNHPPPYIPPAHFNPQGPPYQYQNPYQTPPTMTYPPPSQTHPPTEVFLGFTHGYSTSRPVYGPPGANFDSRGNLYFQRENGFKEWIGPWRHASGEITKNPNQRAEEDICFPCFGYRQP